MIPKNVVHKPYFEALSCSIGCMVGKKEKGLGWGRNFGQDHIVLSLELNVPALKASLGDPDDVCFRKPVPT